MLKNKKIKKIKILRRGRVCRWLRIGGGWRTAYRWSKPILPEKRVLRYFSATLHRKMYILSFYTINALKTQKNGRLLYVPSYGTQYCVPVAQATHNNITSPERYPPQKQFLWLARVTFLLSMCARSSAPPLLPSLSRWHKKTPPH